MMRNSTISALAVVAFKIYFPKPAQVNKYSWDDVFHLLDKVGLAVD